MKRTTSISLALGAALVAVPAFAAGGGGGHHEPASVTSLLLPIINFTLFCLLLRFAAWPLVQQALRDRRDAVASELERARQEHAEAETALAELEALRASEDAETERVLAEVREEGERARLQILANAKETAERMQRDANLVGQQEQASAERSLRTEVSIDVTARAATLLRERLAGGEPGHVLEGLLGSVAGGAA